MCESREMAATPSGVGSHENLKIEPNCSLDYRWYRVAARVCRRGVPGVLSERVPIAFDLSPTAANFLSILGDLCVARAALDVAAQLLTVSFKLFEIAVQLPAIPVNL